MAVRAADLTAVALLSIAVQPAAAERVTLAGFAIDHTEVTIEAFEAFAAATGRVTAAEAEGGGHEWGAGWVRREGWTVRTPYGAPPSSRDEPAVHVSWFDARDYCAFRGGRLPTRTEWVAAAYTQAVQDGRFEPGRRYPYPTGDSPAGANTRASDPWPRHASVGTTAPGVNGLYDMGGNVWEWLADREGEMALTAGGSWWYGPEAMSAEAMQWKPATFYVVYIGFRCAYARAP